MQASRTTNLLDVIRHDEEVKFRGDMSSVPTWPHLIGLEFMSTAVATIFLVIVAALFNAPLLQQANANAAPNPTKAPWYFLNLQELLLHMDAGYAGIILPSLILFLMCFIPYIDTNPPAPFEDPDRYFSTDKGVPIAIFSAIYTAILLTILIAFDNTVGVKRILVGNNVPFGLELSQWIIPTITMVGLSVLLAFLVRRIYLANTREILIALFTGFVIAYLLTTFVGTAMRGTSMELFAPWNNPGVHEG
jgi:hypothetical protein